MSLTAYAALLSAAGGLILLDKWAFGEFGLSQPIVSCPMLGLVFGDFAVGMFLGCALQLVWIEELPLGGSKPLDYQAAGVVAITSFLFFRRSWLAAHPNLWSHVENRMLLACLVMAALATELGRHSDDLVKRFNARFFRMGMNAKTRGGVVAAHLLALGPSFLRGALLVAVFIAVTAGLEPVLRLLPDFTRAELIVFPLAIGLAGLVRLFVRRERIKMFSIGAAVSGVIWAFWR